MKNKNTKRKAFTLVELLIVIAIIGILFIVLVSKVDFATDKAKNTVQEHIFVPSAIELGGYNSTVIASHEYIDYFIQRVKFLSILKIIM